MADATSGYDAFISYSHTLDGALARALQTGLEQFAKPWYRPRALRVFRDTTSLSANPGLWSSIEKALAHSAWLVLMASPEAARSRWVDREVAWWLVNKSPQRCSWCSPRASSPGMRPDRVTGERGPATSAARRLRRETALGGPALVTRRGPGGPGQPTVAGGRG